MNISKIQPAVNNTFIQRQNNSNVSFKAKLEITDEFIQDVDKTFDDFKKQGYFAGDEIDVEKKIAEYKTGIYRKLKSTAQKIEQEEPKDLTIRLDLTDEYKAFIKSGYEDKKFAKKFYTGKYKLHELRFGTEGQPRAKGSFNLNFLEIDNSMTRFYATLFYGLNLFAKK